MYVLGAAWTRSAPLQTKRAELRSRSWSMPSFHAFVKEKPGRRTLSAIKLMKSDPAAMEAKREESRRAIAGFLGCDEL